MGPNCIHFGILTQIYSIIMSNSIVLDSAQVTQTRAFLFLTSDHQTFGSLFQVRHVTGALIMT